MLQIMASSCSIKGPAAPPRPASSCSVLLAIVRQLQALGMAPAPAPNDHPSTAQTATAPHAVEMVSIKDMVYFDRGHGSRAPDSNDTRGLINQIDKSRFRQIHCSILVQAQCISQAARNRAEQARRDTAQRAETQQVRQFCAHLFKGIWDCPLRLK